jgi:hypothetical protein
VDDLFLPQQSVYTEYGHPEGQATPSYTVTMDVDEYKLGDARNENDDFRIEWPLKSSVTHADLRISVRVIESSSETRRGNVSPSSRGAMTNRQVAVLRLPGCSRYIARCASH